MSKAYKVTKRTVMFDKENPKTVYSVVPVSYGILTTEDVAKQIAAESASTPGDVKNVLDRYAYYVKENIKKGYTIELLGMGYLAIRFITSGTAKSEKEATAKLIQSLVPSFTPSFQIVNGRRVYNLINDKITLVKMTSAGTTSTTEETPGSDTENPSENPDPENPSENPAGGSDTENPSETPSEKPSGGSDSSGSGDDVFVDGDDDSGI